MGSYDERGRRVLDDGRLIVASDDDRWMKAVPAGTETAPDGWHFVTEAEDNWNSDRVVAEAFGMVVAERAERN